MISLIVQSFLDFKNAWQKHIGFGLFSLVLTSYLVVPALAYFFNRILLTYGIGVVLNREVFALLLSFRSALLLFLLAVVAVMAVIVELGVFILIAHQTHLGKPVRVSDAIITTLRSLPRMMGFEVVYLVFLLFAVLPLVKLPVEPVFSGSIEAPSFLMENLMASPWTQGVYVLVMAGLAYLMLRWVFTLHGILIRHQRIRVAMKTSALLTHRIRISLFLRLLLLNVFLLSLGTLLLSLLPLVQEGSGILWSTAVRQFLVTLAGLLSFGYALMLMPLNMTLLTRLYAEEGARVGLLPMEETTLLHSGFMTRVEDGILSLFQKRKWVLFGSIALVLALTMAGLYSVSENLLYQGRDIAVIAHRGGASDAPENSLSAIEEALESGADIIELDVQRTKDGVLVLHHDFSLLRMTGVPNAVSYFTLEELQLLNLGTRGHFDYDGEQIPTLKDALDLIGQKARVLLDVKNYGDTGQFVEDLVTVIEEHGMETSVFVQAFDYSVLRAVRQRNPEIRIGQILYYALGSLSRLDVDFYTIQRGMLSRDLVASARHVGREIYVWTVYTEEELKEVLQYDIDGIITGDVRMAISVLRPERELALEETVP